MPPAVHVSEVLPGAVPDAVIADHVEAKRLILISKDEDCLVLRLPDRFGLIWFRCGNASNRALREWLKPRWPSVERLIAAGERIVEVR